MLFKSVRPLAMMLDASTVAVAPAQSFRHDAVSLDRHANVPVTQRVDDLLRRMMLEKKLRQMDLYSGAVDAVRFILAPVLDSMMRIAVLTFLLLASMVIAAASPADRQPVDYVSPNIGSIGLMLGPTQRFVQYPYGMARLIPHMTPDVVDRYLADKIYSFTAGPGSIMVSTGPVSTKAVDYASEYDHDFETTTPYYYAVDLQTWKAKAEMTATREAAIYRFTLAASPAARFAIELGQQSKLTVDGDDAIEGSQRITGTVSHVATDPA